MKNQYKNFTEYWNINGELLKELGVKELVAKIIWDDAVDTVENVIINKLK